MFTVDIFPGDGKAVVDKTTGTLTWVKTVALNCTRSHCILPYHVFTAKSIQISLKNVLDEAGKANNFIKSWLLSAFLIFCLMQREVHMKHFRCIPKYQVVSRECTCVVVWVANPKLHFSWNTIFTWENDRQTMVIHAIVLETLS